MAIIGERGLDRVELDIGKFLISSDADFVKLKEQQKEVTKKVNPKLVEEFGPYIFLIRSEKIVTILFFCVGGSRKTHKK